MEALRGRGRGDSTPLHGNNFLSGLEFKYLLGSGMTSCFWYDYYTPPTCFLYDYRGLINPYLFLIWLPGLVKSLPTCLWGGWWTVALSRVDLGVSSSRPAPSLIGGPDRWIGRTMMNKRRRAFFCWYGKFPSNNPFFWLHPSYLFKGLRLTPFFLSVRVHI